MILIDNDRAEVRVDGKEIHLARIEFAILNALKLKDGKIATREELAHAIDPVAAKQNAYRLRTIDAHICRIREKIGTKRRGLLKTVSTRGYKLVRG